MLRLGRTERGGSRARRRWAALRAAAWLAGAAVALSACAPRPTGPSLVVVTIDTLRADHLASWGYFRHTAPALERLAGESLIFDNTFSTAAVTLPAHVALWTSRYPNQTGVMHNRNDFTPRPGAPPLLLAQWLRAAGWRTAAFTSATPVGEDTGLPAGFEVYEAPKSTMRPAADTTDRALAWLADTDEPFFLWVHYFEPHGPLEPPEAHRVFHADDALRGFLEARAFSDPDDPALAERQDLYDAEIHTADAALARLVAALQARGLRAWDELAMVVMADHGEGLMEHGVAGHAHLGREQLHIPLLIKLPRSLGVAPGRRTELASTVDVVPTLVANLGLPAPPEVAAGFEGIDLLAGNRDQAFSQGGADAWSLVTPRWRFVEEDGPARLFDRAVDPNELHDRAAEHPDEVARLRARALAVAGKTPADGPLFEIRMTSRERRRQLRALGYVVDEQHP